MLLGLVFGYHSGILSTRAVHGALQLRCREIHMKQTEAHTVAMIPLKVIQQRPSKISLYIHSVFTDSFANFLQSVLIKLGTVGIFNLNRPHLGEAVFCDINGQTGVRVLKKQAHLYDFVYKPIYLSV